MEQKAESWVGWLYEPEPAIGAPNQRRLRAGWGDLQPATQKPCRPLKGLDLVFPRYPGLRCAPSWANCTPTPSGFDLCAFHSAGGSELGSSHIDKCWHPAGCPTLSSAFG